MKTFGKTLAVTALLATVAASFAGGTAMPYTGSIQKRLPDMAFRVDAQGNRVGPIIQLQHEERPAAIPWTMCWDATNADPTTNAILANYYGTNPPYYWFGAAYNNPFVTSDFATLNPGTEGKPATGFHWVGYNSAVVNFVVIAQGAALFGGDPAGADAYGNIGGVALIWAALPVGGWDLYSGDLSGAGLSVAMPYGGGAVHMTTAQEVAGTIIAHPGATQPFFCDMLSTTDLVPGTNTSSGTEYQWDDDAPSDFVHGTGELYTYVDAVRGNQHAMAGFFTDDATNVNAEGAFNLEGLTPGCEIAAYCDMVAVDANDTPLLDGNGDVIWAEAAVALGMNGEFSILHPRLTDASTNPVNRYILSYKGSTFLRKNTVVDFTGGDVLGLSIFCMNGDVDGDNEVGPGDFGQLSAAFGTAVGDTGYDAFADLDCDGEVGPSDFGLLSSNFGNAGDDDLTP